VLASQTPTGTPGHHRAPVPDPGAPLTYPYPPTPDLHISTPAGVCPRVTRVKLVHARPYDLEMNNIPALPAIEGDLLLDVLTRQYNRNTSSPPDNTEHGGAERLAELGHAVLSMTIMYILFHRTPFLSAADLSVCHRSKHSAAQSMSSSPCHRKSTHN
jgi:hypothetical protein